LFQNHIRMKEISNMDAKINYEDIDMLEELGKGGSATVIKAYNKRNCEFWALKFFEIQWLPGQKSWDKSKSIHKILEEKKLLENASQLNSKMNYKVFLEFKTMYVENEIKNKEKQIILAMEYGLGTMKEVLKICSCYLESKSAISYVTSQKLF